MTDAQIVHAAPYRPVADAQRFLDGILNLLKDARPISHRFVSPIRYLARLPGGQLYFDSELQLDTDGWPDGGGRGDSSWQAHTNMSYGDGGSINANTVPYYVLPLRWFAQFGIRLGDLAAVIYRGKLAFATFADEGPTNKLGEGSLELLRRLGQERLRSNGTVINAGIGPGVITIVFPGSAPAGRPKSESTLLRFIEQQGSNLFTALGGSIDPP